MQNFDVIIFGAGMVGAAAALGLAKQHKRIAMIEPHLPDDDFTALPDLRVSAVSLGTERLLSDLGVWQTLPENRLNAYSQLSVWESESSKTTFNADLIGEHRLGHILENRLLQVSLIDQLRQFKDVIWFRQGSIIDAQSGEVAVDEGERIKAQLLIVAEGAQSKTRDRVGLGTTGWQYQQQVLGISVTLPHDSGHHTWQQFTPTGPKGFLPLFGNHASLVWYGSKEEIRGLLALSGNDFRTQIVQAFPQLSKDLSVNATATFPITRMHANRYGKGRVVLAGDAAHAINPLAGQGVNLGFRDVRCLLELLGEDATMINEPNRLLKAYARQRRPDNLLMMSAMDGFYALFSNDNSLLKFLRNTALTMADKQMFAKQQVLKYAAGV